MSDTGEDRPLVFTIGHSNHELARLLELLRQHGITAVGDVRSEPHSRYNPQFNAEPLKVVLENNGLRYVFLGKELGARRDEPECYVDGVARYERIAQTPAFREGLARVASGAKTHRIALLCAEKDPLTCHRMLLVARHLAAAGVRVEHIREDGTLEAMAAAEERLVRLFYPDGRDLFHTRAQLIAEAYERQAEKTQYAANATSEAGEE
jgi:uncharacterized protein (DUF488 family)